MEESEKRRERLKAMRMEAAQAGVNTDSESSGFPSRGLSNPLIESETTSASSLQYTSPRFDYYTDPMAAFSGSRRRNNTSHQVSQGHYNTPPRPVYRGMTPTPVYQNPPPNPPGPVYHGMTPTPVYQNPPPNPPGQRIFHPPGAHFSHGPIGSPMEANSPLSRPQGNPPSAWGGSGGAFSYSRPPNLYRGGNFSSPGFGGDSPNVKYGRGRGQGYNSSSHYDSGRGRGRSTANSMSPSSGPSSSRGRGSRDSVSAELRPDLYYSKDMLEDPWKNMTPVVWKGVPASDSDKSWLPKSIQTKKAKVSSQASQPSISQQSLAEYLAASFNDSNDEAVDEERGT
ncbi:protein SICKLE [Sesamum alatum]|uniref:Protein SICKLE n=1 Tax=Sesamum alatum TaxID=300844 RepID=A0AAE2CP87_9LAMI|nr:protein SICKLE [Sesamum alatum]